MKLKDILNKKKPVVKEDIYSKMDIKSNIAQTWKDEDIMEEDLVAWFDASVRAGSSDLGDDIIYGIKKALTRMVKINNAYRRS